MRNVIAVLAVLAVAGAVLAATPATEPASKPATMAGAFVKVDGDKLVLKVKEAGQKELVEKTVLTTDKTTVKIGDAEGKLADLKAGQMIQVTLDGAAAEPTATAVKARAARAPKATTAPSAK